MTMSKTMAAEENNKNVSNIYGSIPNGDHLLLNDDGKYFVPIKDAKGVPVYVIDPIICNIDLVAVAVLPPKSKSSVICTTDVEQSDWGVIVGVEQGMYEIDTPPYKLGDVVKFHTRHTMCELTNEFEFYKDVEIVCMKYNNIFVFKGSVNYEIAK